MKELHSLLRGLIITYSILSKLVIKHHSLFKQKVHQADPIFFKYQVHKLLFWP